MTGREARVIPTDPAPPVQRVRLLEAAGLRKRFLGPQPVEVLQEVDLAVFPGELVAIVGPSGSGKSTLLSLLGGLDHPTAGKVFFQGKNIYGLNDRERSRLRNSSFGFVFQFYHLVPEMTALENVLLPLWIKNGSRPPASGQAWTKELLSRVGLSMRMSHRPQQLSGGEQQRVAIARALVNRPQVIFCDEPTGSLDSVSGGNVLDLVVDLNRNLGTTFVMVTHEPSVTRIAGRVLSLKDGRLWV